MYDGRLLTGYGNDKGVGRMEKKQIDELEPYLEKRNGFSWLPQNDTDYYVSEAVHNTVKHSQQERDVMNIPDYLLWSIANFFLFFVFGIICIILSVRVREHKLTLDYEKTLRLSKRTLALNIFTTIVGIAFLATMLGLLINKSSSNF